MVRKLFIGLLMLALIFTAAGTGLYTDTADARPQHAQGKAHNVILLIPDGFSAAYATNYRLYKGEPTLFDQMLVGMMQTSSADNAVTDSAAAGTAMATGVKTNNGMLGMTPDGKVLKTILEAAKEQGKSTGLVATSTITHATPAAFAAKVESRGQEADIAPQLLNKVDVLLGGGKQFFLPESEGGKQKEGNLLEEAQANGYQLIENRDELLAAQGKKLLGLFADGPMAAELDRDETREPSLAEMTRAAIEVLKQNKKGFFLMVEGSQIDWAGHAHDAAWAMKDTEAFELAVKEAVEFAQQDGRTLVIVASDHDTGGMSVGGYDEYNSNVEILHNVTATGQFLAAQIDEQGNNIRQVLGEYANLELTDEEVERIQQAENRTMAINTIISERAYVGWSSTAHTGVDVPVYAYGAGADLFRGWMDNTELPHRIAQAMKIEFKQE
ncbi:alkaline phosphatase [Caldalkalibacillus uzonensis]|uniref:Alkaline phosphatase n=1 Tax=Caldalkalibacillus uzonensis TaxID=353224 RepID=A0ABU0CUK2_9BACI|nr:alkaline phosphatase [Caldalkalibacillus uzonensis]MDQ0340108.1 alkaline phosphatase [Caldalkalibacillus uzonensis]